MSCHVADYFPKVTLKPLEILLEVKPCEQVQSSGLFHGQEGDTEWP